MKEEDGIDRDRLGMSEKNVDDRLVASVLSAGLQAGVLRREEVIAWVDREIEQRPDPPPWLIEVSMSDKKGVQDTIHLLDQAGFGNLSDAGIPLKDRERIFRGILSLAPDPTGWDAIRGEALATEIRCLAFKCIDPEENFLEIPEKRLLLSEADTLEDEFVYIRDGEKSFTVEGAIEIVRSYISVNGDDIVRQRLNPMRWRLSDNLSAPAP